MSQITSNELALAGIAGTLIGLLGGGYISYLAQGRSTKNTLDGQRELAHDQRLWDKRAALYPILMDAVHQVSLTAQLIAQRPPTQLVDANSIQALEIHTRIIFDRLAEMDVYVSDQIAPIWHEYSEALAMFLDTNKSVQKELSSSRQPEVAKLSAFTADTKQLISLSNDLRTQLRQEILRSSSNETSD